MLKTFIISLHLIVMAFLAGIVFGFIRHGLFTLIYTFVACLLLGVLFIFMGLLVRLLPNFLKVDKLTDHTTFAERFSDKHIEKQKKGNEFLFLGLLIVIISGLIQIALGALLPAG